MIRKAGDIRAERRVIGGGNGEIILEHRLEKEELCGKGRLCAELVIEPGCSIGRHIHENETEIFYVLEGELVSVNDDGSEEAFVAGDVMSTGGGASHCLRNDSGRPARMLAVICV